MGNTLTRLIPDLYAALNVVSRELTGFIPAVTLDANAARAAMGQDVVVPIAPAAQATDITPAVTPPNDGDQTMENTTIRITKARRVPFRWTGEEQRGVNFGVGYLSLRQQQIAQAIRTLVNEMEADLGLLYRRSSRAIGTAGTTPFGTSTKSVDDGADVLKVLLDNGCPMSDLQLVLDTTAGANMRKVPNLIRVNESGDAGLLRQGLLGNIYGMDVRESAGVFGHVKGGGSAYVTSGSTAVGARDIALITGSGTVLAGDVVTFAADANNKYVVGTGVAAPGTISLNAPGARVVIPSANALTIGNSYRANMAFHRSAMILACRAPALPEEGDAALDRTIVTDPRTGLSFEVSMYAQYRQIQYEIAMAWGCANIKPDHTAILMG